MEEAVLGPDLATRPKEPYSTVLSPEDEAVIVAFRRQLCCRWKTASVTNSDHRLDLDGDIAWQGADTDRGSRVLTSIAQHFHEEIGAAVDDGRLIAEIRHGIDHAKKFHDALDPAEVAENVLHDRQ